MRLHDYARFENNRKGGQVRIETYFLDRSERKYPHKDFWVNPDFDFGQWVKEFSLAEGAPIKEEGRFRFYLDPIGYEQYDELVVRLLTPRDPDTLEIGRVYQHDEGHHLVFIGRSDKDWEESSGQYKSFYTDYICHFLHFEDKKIVDIRYKQKQPYGHVWEKKGGLPIGPSTKQLGLV